MMKRIFAFLLIIVCGFAFTGCSQQVRNYKFDEDKPWGKYDNSYEKATYSVKLMQRVTVDGTATDGIELGKGQLVYELSHITLDGVSYVRLISDFKMEYYDLTENGINRNCTDTIKSEVRFVREGLGVSYSEKTYTEQPRRTSSDPSAEYKDTNSYYVRADYRANTAVANKGQTVNKTTGVIENPSRYIDESTFSLTSSETRYFDNEQLFYIVRALEGTIAGASDVINISNIYEIASSIAKNGKYSFVEFGFSASETLVPVILDKSFASNYIEADENGDYTVNCMQISVFKNDAEAGPATQIVMTDPSVSFIRGINVTKKLIVSMKTVQYDLVSRVEATNIIYTLSDYTTEFGN